MDKSIIAQVKAELQDSLTQRGILQWWDGHNRYLGGERPVDVLEAGEGERVLEAARAFRDGEYL